MIDEPIIILCGGFGTRLKSITNSTPKSLVKVNGVPFLDLLIKNLMRNGFSKFIFSLHYKYQDFISSLKKLKINFPKKIEFDYVVEQVPLGTGGAIRNVLSEVKIKNFFFVINGDTWIGDGFNSLINDHDYNLGLVEIDNTSRFGTIKLNNFSRIIKFDEKKGLIEPGIINAGVYRFNKKIFMEFNKKIFSIENDLFPTLVSKNKLFGCILNTNFIDIGVPEDYKLFCKMNIK
jgi:NDP-sugar pyrophosphorylase family protein